jgi:hypothetical protein
LLEPHAAWEHTFVTAQPNAHARFRRAIERRALWLAEDAARELPQLSLADALQLVYLYADRNSPKYERAALRWLGRYLAESEPTLERFATAAARLAEFEGEATGERIIALPGGREWRAIEEDEWDGGEA